MIMKTNKLIKNTIYIILFIMTVLPMFGCSSGVSLADYNTGYSNSDSGVKSPEKPVEPSAPVNPTEPLSPDEVAAPNAVETPSNPAAPADVEEVDEPEKPADIIKSDGEITVEPVRPVDSVKPVTPFTPSASDDTE